MEKLGTSSVIASAAKQSRIDNLDPVVKPRDDRTGLLRRKLLAMTEWK